MEKREQQASIRQETQHITLIRTWGSGSLASVSVVRTAVLTSTVVTIFCDALVLRHKGTHYLPINTKISISEGRHWTKDLVCDAHSDDYRGLYREVNRFQMSLDL